MSSQGGNTYYTQRDVEEARGSLHLLKKRLSNSRDRSKNQTIDHTANSFGSAGNPRRDSGGLSSGAGSTGPGTLLGASNRGSVSTRNASYQGQSINNQNNNNSGGQFGHVPRPPQKATGTQNLLKKNAALNDSGVLDSNSQGNASNG